MSHTTIRIRRSAMALTVAALSFGLAPMAHAGSDDIRTSGTCSMGSTWKLKAKPDNGRIQVEFEVDSNRVGQAWAVAWRDNGILVHQGVHRTVAPSGSFTVEQRIANRAGADLITARATQAATGEVCSGRLTFPG